jgi:hypothetical protein
VFCNDGCAEILGRMSDIVDEVGMEDVSCGSERDGWDVGRRERGRRENCLNGVSCEGCSARIWWQLTCWRGCFGVIVTFEKVN